MATFTVSKKDILNSEIPPLLPNAYGSYYFTTQTDSGFRGLKTTFLKPATQSWVNAPLIGGSIDWREKTFEIGGVVKKWKTLKNRLGSVFHKFPLSEWCWTDRRYTVKREKKQWTVTCEGLASNPTAIFTSRKDHLFSHSDPASIAFATNMPHEEMIFLLLVLLWCEQKRLKAEGELAEAADEVGGGVVSALAS